MKYCTTFLAAIAATFFLFTIPAAADGINEDAVPAKPSSAPTSPMSPAVPMGPQSPMVMTSKGPKHPPAHPPRPVHPYGHEYKRAHSLGVDTDSLRLGYTEIARTGGGDYKSTTNERGYSKAESTIHGRADRHGTHLEAGVKQRVKQKLSSESSLITRESASVLSIHETATRNRVSVSASDRLTKAPVHPGDDGGD